MNFMKKLFLGSVFALGSIGLTACGDDSSSAGDGDSSSSAEELVLSSVSETSPLADFSEVEAERTADGKGGWVLKLTGNIATESDAFETPGYNGDPITYMVDSLSFDVGRKEDGKVIRVGNLPVPVRSTFKFPKEQFNPLFAIDEIPLNQDSIGWGDFVLYITVYMSGSAEEKTYAFTARLEAEFDLPKPAEVSSSSVAEVCTQLTPVGDTLSNISTSVVKKFEINFAGGATAHATISFKDETGYLVAASGVSFKEITSYDDEINSRGMFAPPAAPVCLEKFTTGNDSMNEIEMRENTRWYMAITPDGNFPINPVRLEASGTEGRMFLTYYKKTN